MAFFKSCASIHCYKLRFRKIRKKIGEWRMTPCFLRMPMVLPLLPTLRLWRVATQLCRDGKEEISSPYLHNEKNPFPISHMKVLDLLYFQRSLHFQRHY